MIPMLLRPTARLAVLGLLALAALVGASPDTGSAQPTAASASPAITLTVRGTQYGTILVDGRGRALYAFTRDRRGGPSECYGACAKAWPVYFAAGQPRAGTGVKAALLGTTRRRDGRRQVTYNGWPLYYYVGDRKPGEVKCQGVVNFGGTWLVVAPGGRLVR